ncbi:MAG: Fur family transcriptional regulator [Bacteroidota bacterium]
MDGSHIDQKLSEFTRLSRERGLSITHQRLAVYRELLASGEHPDAETIYKSIHEKYPTISLATVYKALDTLLELGVITMVKSTDGIMRFDANTDPHHHLVCVRCGKLVDIGSEELGPLPALRSRLKGFKVINYSIEVEGICAECQAKGQSTS